MTIQAFQAANQFNVLIQGAGWTGKAVYAVLGGDTVPLNDAHTTLADNGTGGTEAQVAADTADWINAGSGAPVDLTTLTTVDNAGEAELRIGANIAFGTGGISGVKYCRFYEGTAAGSSSTDNYLGGMDLRTEDSADVSAASGAAFTLTVPATGIVRYPVQA